MAKNTELNIDILFKIYKLGSIQTKPKTLDFFKIK